jgi:hypothetical protein
MVEWTVLSRTQEGSEKGESAVNQVAVMPSFRLARQRSSLHRLQDAIHGAALIVI